MNWAALIPIAIKYGPLLISFIHTEGPGIQAFAIEVQDAIQAAKNPDGTIDWVKLIPLVVKYLPKALPFIQTQGVQIEHIVTDIMNALKGQPPSGAAPPLSGAAVLSGPGFVFPPQ